jgi:hypothetical protein
VKTSDQIDHERRVVASRTEMRIRLADGAAWADTVDRCGLLPELLDELARRAGRTGADVRRDVELFRRWKDGAFVPLDMDGRVIAINLAAHIEMSQRAARRDGLEELEPVPVLDRGAY